MSQKKSNHISQPMIKKNLRGYGGNYSITFSGIITDKKGMSVPKVLGKTGYYFVTLKKDGKDISKRIDKLVAHNFRHNPDKRKRTEVVAIDGNKQNTLYLNLLWATPNQFKNYKIKEKTSATKQSKGVVVIDNHTGKETKYDSPKLAATAIGLTPQKLRKALRDKFKILNFTFKYQ